MVELYPVHIRQLLVPIVFVFLHDPDFVFRVFDTAKWAGARIDLDFAKVVMVVFQRFLAQDHVEAASERRQQRLH